MPDEAGGNSPTFRYGDAQFYIMLQALGDISAEDYEGICKQVVLLRMFIAEEHGKAGAKRALGQLQDKLDEIDQFVRVALRDANLAEQQGELFLADAAVVIKEEAKPSGAKFKAPHIDFDTWDGKQEKFFSWMSTTIKMKELAGIHDAQAQVMVMKKFSMIVTSFLIPPPVTSGKDLTSSMISG